MMPNNASTETRQQRRYRARHEKKNIALPQKNAFYRAMNIAKQVADALRASMNLSPIAMKLAMMDLAVKLGQYKSRGKGRGSEGRNWLRPYTNGRRPHQSGQECLRRAIGGWGFRKQFTGLMKRQTLALIAAHGKIRLETAIQIVNGLQPQMVPVI